MKKKFLAVLLAAACTSATLVGCGGAADTATSVKETKTEATKETAAPAEEKTETAEPKLSGEITVASWNAAADALTDIAKLFMEKNPGTKITINKVDAQYTKLYPALAAGVGVPDVMQTQQTDFPAFMNKYEGSFADLTDMVEPEKDNFVASALSQTIGADGKYYAVPWDIGPSALMYRIDVFEKAGVDVNTIKTWDDYIKAGKTVLDKTGMKMLGFCYNGSSSTDYIRMLMHEQSGSYYNEDGTVNLGSDKMITAAKLLLTMKDAGITMDLPSEWGDRITALTNNQLATIPYPVWYTGTLTTAVADQSGKWAIAPMPSFDGTNNKVSLGGSILAVSAASENADLAKAFVKFAMMTNEGAKVNYDYGQFPSYKAAYGSDAFKQKSDYFNASIGEIFIPLVDSPIINFGPYFTDVSTALGTAVGEIFINGADPKTSLDAASKVAQKAIDAQQ